MPVSEMLQERGNHALYRLNNRIFAFGGNQTLSSEVMDINEWSWSLLPDILPFETTDISHFTACYWNGAIHIGGMQSSRIVKLDL
jgi:hypothetical protein